jgi:RNA recognition motif-containing protein
MLPKNVSEVEVSALFSKYGTIKDLQILRGSQQTSKGVLILQLNSLYSVRILAFLIHNLQGLFIVLLPCCSRLCIFEV